MSVKEMTCQSCGQSKQWPAAFPSSMYAECWQCVWDAHMAEQHPISRAKRRQIRKQARLIVKQRLTAEARDIIDAIHDLDDPAGVRVGTE